MKTLGGMFSEEDKRKAHPVKEGEGADDKTYVRLLEEYKRARRCDAKEANKMLEQATALAKNGDVSKKAKIAGAYI